jgi:2,6-dihydroxypyridine 3-monooxygenase
MPVARRALQRARAAGRSLQAGTWRVGDQPPFGLQVPEDSVLPVAL